ncbi:exopolysaccharide transport family protein [uncultured Mucilaginibacter sp.]|uniref:exopolysaccharide transport family protein n=1 Tax=uncultured Mucilaginibacter sp. TaxID=797541 RepID=UPI0025F60F5A|nr:AAA family ATPase [uncultured Mucilaginibacter sp.]
MELSSYFSLVGKYKYIIVIIVLAMVIASYFIVKNLPDQYVSSTQIATGIVDASRHLLDSKDNPNAQQDQINREFSNLTEIIKLKKLVDNVSYQLIIHDLSSPAPFRKLNHKFKDLSPDAVKHALLVYRAKLQNGEPLSLYSADEKGLNELLISMKYDERSLRKDLDIERDGESDFIRITYSSENPELSAFIVNTLSKEFISYYTVNVKQNESNALDFLSKLLEEKRNTLNNKKDSLQQYKIKNGILNVEDQAKDIFAQMLIYNDKKIEAERNIQSYDGAVKAIDNRFNPKDRQYIESTISQYNQSITNTADQLRTLNDEYVHSGFNPSYKPALDSMQKQLTAQIDNTSDKYITNPLVNKDNLVAKKLELEVTRDLAKYSVQSIDKELADLKAKYDRLVPFDAKVKTYESDITIASQEYLDVLNKFNALNLQSNFSIKLMQVEPATPDVAEPSKKMLLIALSGIGAFVICLLILFILYYLDDNIKEPIDLVNATQLPLLGSLNLISGPKLDLKKLWDVENQQKMQQFKELLRSVRFEIDQELKGGKVLGITSLVAGEGKTLVATSLAYSYSAINKKVLLIDGNFNNPTLSKTIQPKLFVEDYFRNNSYIERDNSSISVLGNRGGDITLLEINDEKNIQREFEDLKSRYDIILIDLPPLDSLNQSKEWLLFCCKAVAIFETNKGISRSQTQYIDYLKHLNLKFAGWVLNKAAIRNHSKQSKH